VINGALVTACGDCVLEVGSGACVFVGPVARPPAAGICNPRDELYFSLIDCRADPRRIDRARIRLLGLLGEIAVHDHAHETQRECSLCVAAIMCADAKAAVESAARLAASDLESRSKRVCPSGVTDPLLGDIEPGDVNSGGFDFSKI